MWKQCCHRFIILFPSAPSAGQNFTAEKQRQLWDMTGTLAIMMAEF